MKTFDRGGVRKQNFRYNRKNIQLNAIAIAVDLEYFEEYDLSR